MLLYRNPGEKTTSREELLDRFRKFWQGSWMELIRIAHTASFSAPAFPSTFSEARQRELKAERADALVCMGEPSAARQVLESAELAPGDLQTLESLQNSRPQQMHRAIPQDLFERGTVVPATLRYDYFVGNLRRARRGAAPGPSGITAEHLRPLLDDESDAKLLHEACTQMAQAHMPEDILQAIKLGRLTALKKSQGGVRGIVAGDFARRLVARTFAQQHGPEIERACRPFQYALSTRAGTECVAHALQASVAMDASTCILSIDGISAFDSMSRAAMMEGLAALPNASSMLPFVLSFYGRDSQYLWCDKEGQTHTVYQSEGGEQGDPLMPLLYALGQHPALDRVAQHLRGNERIYAFLDDVYITCPPERVRILYDLLSQCLREQAQIQVHVGKTRIWNRAGIEPINCADLRDAGGQAAWRGDTSLPTSEQGVTVLGTPIGHPDFVEASLTAIALKHQKLLDVLPGVPNLQSAWILLSMCAATRANYYLRALSPGSVLSFAQQHDNAVWSCLKNLLGADLDEATDARARSIAQLPLRYGGLGLRSSCRTSPAAYWASWADSLQMIRERHPQMARALTETFAREDLLPDNSLGQVNACATHLQSQGNFRAPTWHALAHGMRPQQADGEERDRDPGEWQHGWQFYAADALERTYRNNSLLPQLQRGDQALLRSQSGLGAAAAFTALPTSDDTAFSPQEMRILIQRRLRLPLPALPRRCRCGCLLDTLGDHRAACPRAGILASRGFALEAMAARICREAKGRVSTNVMVRDLNIEAAVGDARRLEVVVNNLPLFGGSQLAIDTTLVSPVRANGQSIPGAFRHDGVALKRAKQRKQRTYPELTGGRGRTRLLVMALEIGGRWNHDAYHFLRHLAKARSREVPEYIRKSAELAWHRRWLRMMACTSQRALASSLLDLPPTFRVAGVGVTPRDEDVLADDRWYTAPPNSRLM